jgi:phenylacetate-CoA ligase
MRWVAEALYWSIERIRTGGEPGLARQARALLDQSRERIDSYVEKRLRASHHAGNSPRLWLTEQPVTNKSDYAAVPVGAERSRSGVQHRRTSGSSGQPFGFIREPEQLRWMDAAMWAVYGWHGVRPGLRQARFWGLPLAKTERWKRRLLDNLYRRRRFDAFSITPERAVAYARLLERFKPEFVYGYPTLMGEFVSLCRSQGLCEASYDVRAVICTGEVLADQVEREVASFFNAPVLNEYGCTEMGIISFPCESGTNHEIPIAALAEVLDDALEKSVEEGTGKIVLTDLYGSRQPFRRYALGDLVRTNTGACSCGRDLPALIPSVGRADGIIQTSSGRRIYDAVLAYTVPAGVSAFRAEQTSIDEICVQIVVKGGVDPVAVSEEAERRWSEAVEGAIRFRIDVVTEIPRERSGKLRYFIPLDG